MKWRVLILMLLFLAAQASAANLQERGRETENAGNSYFKVFNVSPINLNPNSEVNFTVNLKSMGGNGAFAQPIFNTSKGFSATAPGGLKYIAATGNRTYNCTMRAENVTSGNYSFEVGVYAQSAPYSWRTAYINVEPKIKLIDAIANQSKNASEPQDANKSLNAQNSRARNERNSPMGTPGPGFVLALAALIMAARNARN